MAAPWPALSYWELCQQSEGTTLFPPPTRHSPSLAVLLEHSGLLWAWPAHEYASSSTWPSPGSSQWLPRTWHVALPRGLTSSQCSGLRYLVVSLHTTHSLRAKDPVLLWLRRPAPSLIMTYRVPHRLCGLDARLTPALPVPAPTSTGCAFGLS